MSKEKIDVIVFQVDTNDERVIKRIADICESNLPEYKVMVMSKGITPIGIIGGERLISLFERLENLIKKKVFKCPKKK